MKIIDLPATGHTATVLKRTESPRSTVAVALPQSHDDPYTLRTSLLRYGRPSVTTPLSPGISREHGSHSGKGNCTLCRKLREQAADHLTAVRAALAAPIGPVQSGPLVTNTTDAATESEQYALHRERVLDSRLARFLPGESRHGRAIHRPDGTTRVALHDGTSFPCVTAYQSPTGNGYTAQIEYKLRYCESRLAVLQSRYVVDRMAEMSSQDLWNAVISGKPSIASETYRITNVLKRAIQRHRESLANLEFKPAAKVIADDRARAKTAARTRAYRARLATK